MKPKQKKPNKKMPLCEVPEWQILPYGDSSTTRPPKEMLWFCVSHPQE